MKCDKSTNNSANLLFLLHIPGADLPSRIMGPGSQHTGDARSSDFLKAPRQLRGRAGTRLNRPRPNTALVSAADDEESGCPFPPPEPCPPSSHRWAAGAGECVRKHTSTATCALPGAHKRGPYPWCHRVSQQLSRNLWAAPLLPPTFRGASFHVFHFMDNSEPLCRGN